MTSAVPNRYLVLKWEDINDFLNSAEKEILQDVVCKLNMHRIANGKPIFNTYLILNIDEPYMPQIFEIMYEHGHTPCSDCTEEQKADLCKPGKCAWYKLYSTHGNNKVTKGDYLNTKLFKCPGCGMVFDHCIISH